MTNVLTVALDAAMVTRISALGNHHVVSISRENFHSVQPDESFLPDLILVGTDLTSEQAVRYAQRVLSEYPAVVVMLVADPGHDLIREATRVGIRGVINSTISDKELGNLIERAGHSIQDSTGIDQLPHQVIVVASPKGGVGKTMVAANLSALLAEQAPNEVVLLDLDLQFGDVSTVLDLHPEFTVADALNSGAADSMLLRTLLVPHPADFYVLCGADHPAAAGHVTGDQVRKLVSQFSHDFRYVVIDTAAGLPEETLASLEEATDVAFVSTLDVAALRSVRKEIDVLAELGLLPQRRHVLLNRSDRLSGLTQRDAENIVGLPVEVVVPTSATVPLAANHGLLAVHIKRKNTVRRPLRAFARIVSDHSRNEHPNPTEDRPETGLTEKGRPEKGRPEKGRSPRGRSERRSSELRKSARPGRHR